jgi:hypothetical protein
MSAPSDGRGSVSERDAVRREREAYKRGAVAIGVPWERYHQSSGCPKDHRHIAAISTPHVWWDCLSLDEAVAKFYPMPKIERPRVLKDPHGTHEGIQYFWKAEHGVVEIGHEWSAGFTWSRPTYGTLFHLINPTPERIAVWADLLAHPTELVEDDGSADRAGGAA